MKDLLKNDRMLLMGFATLWILLGHTIFYGKGNIYYGAIINEIITMGFMGVDIFLLLSSFGLCNSYEKNKIREFYRHRINRLLPTLIVIAIIFIAIHRPQLKTIFNPLFWFSNYWYIGFIIIMYILFPLIYKYFKKVSSFKGHFAAFLISFVLLFYYFCSGTCVNCNPSVCAISRIPIFCLGILVWMGKAKYLNNIYILYLMLLIGIITLIPYYYVNDLGGNKYLTNYYSLFLITPPHGQIVQLLQAL